MKSSKNTPVMQIFIALIAMASMAGATELTATGTNTVIGTAWAEGDIFATKTPITGSISDLLYAGVWAHAYVPTGTDGTNSAESQRTVPAKTESRTFASPITYELTYNLKSSYGDMTVIAKASKTGVIGLAEAFSEGSSTSRVMDYAGINPPGEPKGSEIAGNSQLVAFITHTGTGAANASVSGSADYSARIKTGEFAVSGSINGSAALNAINNYGGSVTGTAWKKSSSFVSLRKQDSLNYEETNSNSFEYLSLSSSRDSLSALSTIDGAVSGPASASGFYALSSKGKFGSSESHLSGDLSAIATTYKLGDSIFPGQFYYQPGYDMATQLDNEVGDTTKTSLGWTLWENGGSGYYVSSYLASGSGASVDPGANYCSAAAITNSFTSAGVTRTLSDANQAYGASFIDNGTVSANAEIASAPAARPGACPITFASAGVDNIFMGSGAHLVSRLTDSYPTSTADLMIYAYDNAYFGASPYSDSPSSYGSVEVKGYTNGPSYVVRAVGPSYSPSGTFADATGSYLMATNIGGTSLHTTDKTYTSPSKRISNDISEINIWSWIAGDDSRTHAESKYGLFPHVATPVYTSDPIGVVGVTTGPTVTSDVAVTSRSVDVVFGSGIQY